MSFLRKPGVQVGIRVAFAILFLWSAVSKLANPSAFLGSVYGYELPLPRYLLQLVAIALPWVELLCGVLLLTKVWLEGAWACVVGMTALFVVATGQAWARGLKISCGCFDLKMLGLSAESPVVRFIESVGFGFFRNLVLLVLASVALQTVRGWGREVPCYHAKAVDLPRAKKAPGADPRPARSKRQRNCLS